MSQYKRLVTTFRNFESLKKALNEVGIGEMCEFNRIPTENTMSLVGYGGSAQSQKVAIRLPKSRTHGYEDTGFYYDSNTKTFNAVISTHDNHFPGRLDFGENTLQKVTQRYAVNEAKRVAKTKGYRIVEKPLEDGSIELECVAYR